MRTTVLIVSGKPAAIVATLATLAAQGSRPNRSASEASGTTGQALLCPPIGVLETRRLAARELQVSFTPAVNATLSPGHLVE